MSKSSLIDLGDLSRQSNQLLEVAQIEAKQIIKEAKEKAEKIIEGASEKGFAQGKEQGSIDGREEGLDKGRKEALEQFTPELVELKTSFSKAIVNWEDERNQLYQEARDDVIEFAMTMAKKITHRLVQTDSTIIKDQIVEALALLAEPTSALVSVAPQDRQTIDSILPEILQQIKNCTHIELKEDQALTPGGCIITTKQGSIDATIEKQIDRIVKTICPQEDDKESDRESEV